MYSTPIEIVRPWLMVCSSSLKSERINPVWLQYFHLILITNELFCSGGKKIIGGMGGKIKNLSMKFVGPKIASKSLNTD